MLQEADFATTQQAMLQGQQQPSRVYVKFFTKPKQDVKKSAEEGRPIFLELPYIEIRTPGDKKTVISRPVRDEDKQKFYQQWEAFERGLDQPLDGTPLSEWPAVTRSQVEELKHFGVMTVEHLAALSDTNAQKFMAINALRQKARDWLAAAEGNAPISKLEAENDTLKNQIGAMQDQIDQLIQASVEKAASRRPPPKAKS